MRSRGWQGEPPADDAEARGRIIAAAIRCIARYGHQKTGISDVAAELGVTRPTVYRLFPSTDDLLAAVAIDAADAFVDSLVAHVRHEADPAEMLVECLALTLERLPQERYLSMVVGPDRQAAFARNITSAGGVHLTDALLTRLPVDWPAIGIGPRERADVIEIYLRTLQSFALEPGPTRSPTALRAIVRRWLAPVIDNYRSTTSQA